MQSFYCLLNLSLVLLKLCQCSEGADYDNVDYWSDDFDLNKNCKEEELITELVKDKNITRCAIKSSESDAIQWEDCKKDLSDKLIAACMPRTIKKTGNLLYCKNRGQTSCCFHNEACEENMVKVSNTLPEKAQKYLRDPRESLRNLVENLGYDTCHAITGYDSSKCHQDCKELEKSKFAKNCTENAGLFKCCIRRDKKFCHECRFCCSLSVCTTPEGTYFIGSEKQTDTNSKSNLHATQGYKSGTKLWNDQDYRCLKPNEKVNPEKWPHYEMGGFRAAKTKGELQKVKEIKFDRNFFNLEDPKVWEKFVDKKKGPKFWKKTYGFDFVSIVNQKNGDSNNTICYIDCYKAEQRSFARKCRKRGGLFKCCVISLRMDKFELVRYNLQKAGLISDGPTTESRRCPEDKFSDCTMCGATHICARRNALTGLTEETYKTPYKTAHKIGGRTPEGGLKYFGCFVQSTCDKIGVDYTYEPLEEFRKAATREELCNATQKNSFVQRNETLHKSYYEECLKQKSANVFICPNTTEFRQEDQLASVTKYLKNFKHKHLRKKSSRKNSKIKHKKQKKKKKKKKKKKEKNIKEKKKKKEKKREKEKKKKKRKKEKEKKHKRRKIKDNKKKRH